MEIPAIFEVKYYEPYFESGEIEALRDELSRIGSLRLRTFPKELGGDETNLWIIASWFGLGYASGIVQHVAGKHYERFLNALKKYRSRTQQKEIEYERAAMIVLSYDDLDINITLPSETNINFLTEIIGTIPEYLSKNPLKSLDVNKIFLPYYFDEKEQLWRQTFDWSDVQFEARYWGIQSDPFLSTMSWVEDIYDSEENRLMKAPTDHIMENL